MDEPVCRPRCECCDEVLEELLNIRHNFENYFLRFNNQIVQMRRELGSLKGEKLKVPQNNNNQMSRSIAINDSVSSIAVKRKGRPNSPNPIAPKTSRHVEDIENDNDITENFVSCGETSTLRISRTSTRSERQLKQEPNLSLNMNSSSNCNIRSPLTNFLGISLRVMPTSPFKSEVEFEEWERLLETDPDQREHLREELLQFKFDDPDKFVKHIWSSVLSDDVTECYTYRDSVKTDKKAIKNYNFTAIFKECFTQQYADHDAISFIERTVQFFNKAHSRLIRSNKDHITHSQKVPSDAGSVDELVKVLNENEVYIEDANYQGIQPEEDERHIFTEYNNDRAITVHDFYELRQDFNRLGKSITNELKQQHEVIYNVVANVLKDNTNMMKPNMEQHKYNLISEGRCDLGSLLPKTPFTNIDDFKAFEKSIEDDKEKFEQLVYQFSQLTANGSIKFIKVCWRNLLTDGTAQHLCWKGTDKKDAIRSLSVTAALKTAYDRKYLEHTDVEFERTCMIFFQHAKNRHEKKQAYKAYQSLSKPPIENQNDL